MLNKTKFILFINFLLVTVFLISPGLLMSQPKEDPTADTKGSYGGYVGQTVTFSEVTKNAFQEPLDSPLKRVTEEEFWIEKIKIVTVNPDIIGTEPFKLNMFPEEVYLFVPEDKIVEKENRFYKSKWIPGIVIDRKDRPVGEGNILELQDKENRFYYSGSFRLENDKYFIFEQDDTNTTILKQHKQGLRKPAHREHPKIPTNIEAEKEDL